MNAPSTTEHEIAYHGDLLLSGESNEGDCHLVARFTHGRLEWVRPAGDYPQANYELLREQGAR